MPQRTSTPQHLAVSRKEKRRFERKSLPPATDEKGVVLKNKEGHILFNLTCQECNLTFLGRRLQAFCSVACKWLGRKGEKSPSFKHGMTCWNSTGKEYGAVLRRKFPEKFRELPP